MTEMSVVMRRYLATVVVAALTISCTVGSSGESTGPGDSPAATVSQTATPLATVSENATSSLAAIQTAESTPITARTPTIESTPTVTPAPPSTQAPKAWPIEQVLDRPVDRLAMAIDRSGALHVAAVQNGELIHLTNESGEWSVERPEVPQGIRDEDRIAALAVDGSGRIAVAYERSDCSVGGCMERGGETLVAVIDPDDGPSRAVVLGDGLQPSIALRNGNVHVVWLAGRWSDDGGGCPRPAMYATNESGEWAVKQLAADSADGAFISMRPNDAPAFAIFNGCDYLPDPAYIVTLMPDGSPRLDPVPGMDWGDWIDEFSTDANDRMHLIYEDMDGEHQYLVGAGTDWTSPAPIPGAGYIRGLSVDETGVAHVIAVDRQRLYYSSNATGSFVEELITINSVSTYWGTAELLLDGDAQPQVLFSLGDASEAPTGLWYATRNPT